MIFSELNNAVQELRDSLQSSVHNDALPEITIRTPSGYRDEASFMRLVNWSYVLLFETGRVTIPYLLSLPAKTTTSVANLRESRQIVHSLRTWISHNVGFSSERDNAIRSRVELWFITQCGEIEPSDALAWEKVFRALCLEVHNIIDHCRMSVKESLADPYDREIFVTDRIESRRAKISQF